jgi:predicted alpha/beta superfamily hydrolase
MRLRLKLTLALLTILQFVPLFAQGQASKPAFLADVTSSVMKASATGRSYQISVALPDGYSKQHAPYPVLYAADANPEFGTVVETARVFAEIPGLVIVGIGYPNSGQGFAWVPRALDLTTTPDPKAPGTNGGAAEFLQFIRNDLVPYVERTYNVKQDRAWFGHSFGGLFGIYICSTPVALTDPGFINPQNRRRRLSGQITNSGSEQECEGVS